MILCQCNTRLQRRGIEIIQSIDLLGQISDYPFLNRFLYAAEDPVKQKWTFVKEWSEQCQRDPKLSEKQFKILRQRYELTHLYLDPSLTESNSFLQDIYTKIEDDETYDKPNHKTLTDAQFDVTKRVLHETLAVKRFTAKIPELLEAAKEDIASLPGKTLNFAKFEQQMAAWAKYKFLSFGHPKMVELYLLLLRDGNVPNDRIKDIVVYMKCSGSFSYQHQDFKDALKWFSKMNWVFAHEFAENVHQKELKTYFQILLDRYWRIKSVLEDPAVLERCQYRKMGEAEDGDMVDVTLENVEIWLKGLSKKETDPLMEWLKEMISGEWDDSTAMDMRHAICNRFLLDIGGLMEQHIDVLFPLLHNAQLLALDDSSQIKVHREAVLRGKQLTSAYITELRQFLEPLQQEFQRKAL